MPLVIGILIFLAFIFYINGISSEYKIESVNKSIYVGDSHIKQSIDDRVIPNSLNVAEYSESFYFSYYKLKLLLKSNPSVEKVYLGFSYHSISNYYNQFINGIHSSTIAPKYFFILPIKEQARMIYWNKGRLLSFSKNIIKQGMLKVINNDNKSFIGGYSNSFKDSHAVKSSMDKRIQLQYFQGSSIKPYSELNMYYFYKIVDLCDANGVELYLINTPLHEYYLKKVPYQYTVKLAAIIARTRLNYLDLSSMKLDDESYIPDGDHVSEKGAQFVSKYLRDAE